MCSLWKTDVCHQVIDDMYEVAEFQSRVSRNKSRGLDDSEVV